MASQDVTQSTIRRWIESLREGDDRAAETLWSEYFEKMVRLARHKLGSAPASVRSDEDIALSAFKSFCLGVRRGRFSDLDNVDNLWSILVTITLRKAVDQLRHQNRSKRVTAAGHATNGRESDGSDTDWFDAKQPTPEMLATASDSFQHLLHQLDSSGDPQLSHIVMASLEGSAPNEIARELGCSVRTIQRKLKTARALWEAND